VVQFLSLLGTAIGTAGAWAKAQHSIMSLAIEELIPHRAPMRWIDALTDCTDTTARATVHFSADHFAAAKGEVLETALVECIAQTVAAAQGYRAKTRGNSAGARGGMLAAVSNFQIHCRPSAEQPLTIDVREVKRFGPMLLVSGEISCQGKRVSSGDLMLYA
jgi:predicted hotdog family 3-hydroxylacyl-ACP dehydratase